MTLTLSLLLACATEAPAPEAPATPEPPAAAPAAPTPPAPDSPEGLALAKAGAAGKAFGGALKARIKASMEAGGPPQAITVCSEDAPRIAAELAAEQGVKIGRSSLRLRNPGNIGPDWVQTWLAEQGERSALGVQTMKTIAEVDGQRVARIAVPLPTEALCVTCHGPAEGLAPEVTATLAERYPDDKAVGYAEDDLRGVLWVEAPVPSPPVGG